MPFFLCQDRSSWRALGYATAASLEAFLTWFWIGSTPTNDNLSRRFESRQCGVAAAMEQCRSKNTDGVGGEARGGSGDDSALKRLEETHEEEQFRAAAAAILLDEAAQARRGGRRGAQPVDQCRRGRKAVGACAPKLLRSAWRGPDIPARMNILADAGAGNPPVEGDENEGRRGGAYGSSGNVAGVLRTRTGPSLTT